MFAADARKHTPGKNAEKENFSRCICYAGGYAGDDEHFYCS